MSCTITATPITRQVSLGCPKILQPSAFFENHSRGQETASKIVSICAQHLEAQTCKLSLREKKKLTVFNMFCSAQMKMRFSLTEKLSFYLRPLFSIRLQRVGGNREKPFVGKTLEFRRTMRGGQWTKLYAWPSLGTAIHTM